MEQFLMKARNQIVKILLFLAMIGTLAACSDSDNNNNPNTNNNDDISSEPSIAEIVTNDPDNFSTLLAALQTAELDDDLSEPGTYTVFAPTNDAFAKLGDDTINALLADPDALSDILLYHVIADGVVDAETAVSLAGTTTPMANGDQLALSLSGSNLLVNFSVVITTDVMASNGIIHVIDTVLIPPKEVTTSDLNIVETAQQAGGFDTLLAAAGAAGLVDALSDESASLTVFAPTDEAFEALEAANPGIINNLLNDPVALTAVLLRHVLASQVDQITALSLNGQQVGTFDGQEVGLQILEETLTINNATVTVFDIYASNGIIHVIDAVILPEE
jgi:transforming growth factor-beta-induced protein